MGLRYTTFDAPSEVIGRVWVVASERGLRAVHMRDPERARQRRGRVDPR